MKIFICFLLFSYGLAWGEPSALGQKIDFQESKTSIQENKTGIRVAILPVVIHSPEKLDYLREGLWDMLSSRIELAGRVAVIEKGAVKKALEPIAGEMDAQKAKEVGRSLGADFVVFGSLTKLGESSSLDLRIVDVKGEKSITPVYVQTKKMDEIIAQVDELGRKVDENILGYPLRPAVEAKAAAPAAAAAAAGLAAGAKPPSAEAAAAPGGIPGFRPMRPQGTKAGGVTFGEFFQSIPFPFQVKGMGIADLDGDGRNEVALISQGALWIYRFEANQFKLLTKIEGGKIDNHLAIDVADIDGDGKAEIFVTSLPKEAGKEVNRLTSFVVAYRNGKYETVASNLDWFLRVVEWGNKKVLLGQKKGYRESFEAPIYEMSWDGKALKEIRRASTPPGCTIYGLTTFEYQGQLYFAFIDYMFRLKVTDLKGKSLWRSNWEYGSGNWFQAKPSDNRAGAYYEGDDVSYVNVRLLSRDNELIMIRNLNPIGDIFKIQKVFKGAEIQTLVWNGGMFMEKWKSPEIQGYVADIQTQDLTGDRTPELVVAVNLARESFFSGEMGSALMISRLGGRS